MLAHDTANADAKDQAQALIALGERQINAIARNYYFPRPCTCCAIFRRSEPSRRLETRYASIVALDRQAL